MLFSDLLGIPPFLSGSSEAAPHPTSGPVSAQLSHKSWSDLEGSPDFLELGLLSSHPLPWATPGVALSLPGEAEGGRERVKEQWCLHLVCSLSQDFPILSSPTQHPERASCKYYLR